MRRWCIDFMVVAGMWAGMAISREDAGSPAAAVVACIAAFALVLSRVARYFLDDGDPPVYEDGPGGPGLPLRKQGAGPEAGAQAALRRVA